MEQKMLLPIVLIVLVAGFLIGFYAATGSGVAKNVGSPAQSSAVFLNTDVEDSMVTSAAYMESLVGTLVIMQKDSITITREGKVATIPLLSNTVVTRLSNGNKIVVPFGYPKPGDFVNVRTLTNSDTNKLTLTSVTVLQRAN